MKIALSGDHRGTPGIRLLYEKLKREGKDAQLLGDAGAAVHQHVARLGLEQVAARGLPGVRPCGAATEHRPRQHAYIPIAW